MWPHDQMVMWLHGWIPLTLSYHPAKSGGHRSCTRGDMFLIWHVTSHDHMVRGLCDFIGARKSFGRRDTMFLIFHVTSRDHMIRWPCNSMSGFPSSVGEVMSQHVLCQFQLKIHNTYNDLKRVCNQLIKNAASFFLRIPKFSPKMWFQETNEIRN